MTLVDIAALGNCYCALNRVAEAHRLLATTVESLEVGTRKQRPDSHIAHVQCEYGLILLREGRFADAEIMLRKSLDEYEHNEMRGFSLCLRPRARAVSGLGQALAGQGRFAEAEPLVVQAFQELQANEHRIAGDRAGMVREALDAVVALYTAWGKPDKVAEWQAKRAEPEARPARAAELSADKT